MFNSFTLKLYYLRYFTSKEMSRNLITLMQTINTTLFSDFYNQRNLFLSDDRTTEKKFALIT